MNRLVLCLFAEDIGLLPARMFTRMPGQGGAGRSPSREWPARCSGDGEGRPRRLRTRGVVQRRAVCRRFGLPLARSEIEASILDALFERGLDPDKRSQLGAHYTDRDKIVRIVDPVVVRPLLAE